MEGMMDKFETWIEEEKQSIAVIWFNTPDYDEAMQMKVLTNELNRVLEQYREFKKEENNEKD